MPHQFPISQGLQRVPILERQSPKFFADTGPFAGEQRVLGPRTTGTGLNVPTQAQFEAGQRSRPPGEGGPAVVRGPPGSRLFTEDEFNAAVAEAETRAPEPDSLVQQLANVPPPFAIRGNTPLTLEGVVRTTGIDPNRLLGITGPAGGGSFAPGVASIQTGSQDIFGESMMTLIANLIGALLSQQQGVAQGPQAPAQQPVFSSSLDRLGVNRF